MKRALLVAAVPLFVLACGQTETPPPMTADAASADSPPAGDPATEPPAADAPAGDAPAAGGGEDAWAGEKEAKADGGGADKPAETRTMDVIAKLVKENRKPVRDCMDKVKKQLPDLKGDLVIHFFIDPEGKVSKAELNVEKSSLKNPEVAQCAIDTIKGIKFPPSSRQMQSEVNYPYNLN
jgi:hypothetical protein